MTIKTEGTRWHIRGGGRERDVPCFVTGLREGDVDDLNVSIFGCVESREAGENLVAAFNGLARLECDGFSPGSFQVKVGAAPGLERALGHLATLVVENDHVVTPEIIFQARTGRKLG